jgi:hypothetical protein
MLNNAHLTVYCINNVHKQVEILDPKNWEQKDDKNRYHTAISVQIRERLNIIFQMFAGSLLPDISNRTFPYISVPTQNPKDDCAFFSMLYLENYNGREIGKWTLKLTRLVDTSSQPFSSFVNSQLFIHASHSSFILHFFNNAHFYCVLSIVHSFYTTSYSTV